MTAGNFLKYCHAGYWHNFCDWEWYYIAKARGKFLYVPESKMIHEHWSVGKAERDETYLLQAPYFETDSDLFWTRWALSDGFKKWETLDGSSSLETVPPKGVAPSGAGGCNHV
jgi:hypothetical protein